MKPLPAEELRPNIPEIIFSNIKETNDPPTFIGRERAKKALEFGLDMDDGSYHIFALGPSGIGKRSTILQLLKERVKNESTPDDWCYVFNFQDANRPIALNLPAGQGKLFKEAVDNYIKEIKTRIAKAFESDEYGRLLQTISEEENNRKKQEIDHLSHQAAEYNYEISETPFGLAFVPSISGQALNDTEINKLPKNLQSRLQKGKEILSNEGANLSRHIHNIEKESAEKQSELNKEIISLTIAPLTEELKKRFGKNQKVLDHINNMQKDIIDNADSIKTEFQEKPAENALSRLLSGGQDINAIFDRYSVNLFISHNENKVPIITEHLPTVPHLVGHYEFRPRIGGMSTDFTLIQPGALQKANGGYLVLDAIELLTQPFAWEVLKSTLQSCCIRIEDVGERLPYSLPTPTLRPEPIPLKAKVILIGDPTIYYLLALNDKDFLELFKVKVDFDTEAKLNNRNMAEFASFVDSFTKNELNTSITPAGIRRLVQEAARLAEHKEKISLQYRTLTDILREAKYWANKNKRTIGADEIKKAVEERIYRSNLIESKVQEMIAEKTLFIDTDKTVAGQINGLSVIQLGDYEFGKPSRITARTYVGKEGVANIERQTELSGPIHGKAVLILTNYLGGRYAQEVPLALSATITFEQEYGPVEGDSATLSELCALLSSLSNLPARQDLAITGSANQKGDVQPVGGINQKIEGFFTVCKSQGLTEKQGVIIPASNIKHLILNDEVVEAVRNKKFNIYPVSNIDEAIEIVLATPANKVHQLAEQRLNSYAQSWRRFSNPERE